MSGTLLITGGAKRLGQHMALHFAKTGYNIAIHYNTSKHDAEQTAQQIRDLGRKSCTLQADLLQSNAVENMIPDAIEKIGTLDGLINNAAIFLPDREKNASQHNTINYRAPARLAEIFAQTLPPEKTGNIINILDCQIAGELKKYNLYNQSKKSLWRTTQDHARDFAPNIRVNAVAPFVPLGAEHESAEQIKTWREQNFLRHYGAPEDICHTIEFLLNARAITGQCIFVDGGRHLVY